MASNGKDKKNAEANAKILQDLLKEVENRYCADCNSKGPRWASWTLGVFVCIRCSGIHRSLGVHISKVKSVTLDAWTDEQINSISSIGNAKAKEIYECNVPRNYPIPDETSDNYTVEQWIRAKYERKEFIKRSDQSDSPSRVNNNKPVTDNNANESKISSSQPPSAVPRRQTNPPHRHNNNNNNPTPPSKTTPTTKTATNNMDAESLITLEDPKLSDPANGFSYPTQNGASSGQFAAGGEYFGGGNPASTTPRASKESIMQLFNHPPVAPAQIYTQATTTPNYYAFASSQAGYPQYQYPVYPPATSFTPGVGYTVAGIPYTYPSNGQWKPN